MKKNPHSPDLNSHGLVLFGHIVRSGSLTAAAQQLGLGRAAVSKQLAALEKRIGTRLLQRTTRSLSLTDAGEKVYIESQKITAALQTVHTIANDSQTLLSGHINVSCSHAIGSTHLVPLLTQFHLQYPDIRINLQLEDRFVNLVTENVDVSIRIGELEDSSLIALKLGQLDWQLCASPAYLHTHGTPLAPSDLRDHQCLFYRNAKTSMQTWKFISERGLEAIPIDGPISINDANALIHAAIQGLGVLVIDKALVQTAIDDGKLVPLLPNHPLTPGLPVYIMYPAKNQLPAKTAAFIQFLQQYMKPLITS